MTDEPTPTDEQALKAFLKNLNDRFDAIVKLEAKQTAFGVSGAASRGELIPAKMQLLESMAKILDRLEAMNA